jgi:hypothetical protein
MICIRGYYERLPRLPIGRLAMTEKYAMTSFVVIARIRQPAETKQSKERQILREVQDDKANRLPRFDPKGPLRGSQ